MVELNFMATYLQCTRVSPFPVCCSNCNKSFIKFNMDEALTGTP